MFFSIVDTLKIEKTNQIESFKHGSILSPPLSSDAWIFPTNNARISVGCDHEEESAYAPNNSTSPASCTDSAHNPQPFKKLFDICCAANLRCALMLVAITLVKVSWLHALRSGKISGSQQAFLHQYYQNCPCKRPYLRFRIESPNWASVLLFRISKISNCALWAKKLFHQLKHTCSYNHHWCSTAASFSEKNWNSLFLKNIPPLERCKYWKSPIFYSNEHSSPICKRPRSFLSFN